jgi:hypothetical protein
MKMPAYIYSIAEQVCLEYKLVCVSLAAPVPDWLTAYTPSLAIAEPAPGRFSAYTPSLAIIIYDTLPDKAHTSFVKYVLTF